MFFHSQHLLSLPLLWDNRAFFSVGSPSLQCQSISPAHHCLSTTVNSDQVYALWPLTPESNLYPASRVVPSKPKSDHCSIQNPPTISCLIQCKTQSLQCPCRPSVTRHLVVSDLTFDDSHPFHSCFPLSANAPSSCHVRTFTLAVLFPKTRFPSSATWLALSHISQWAPFTPPAKMPTHISDTPYSTNFYQLLIGPKIILQSI